ncbi:DUF6252 family protein [Flavobacterium taihuense]|uniref:Lipoprotein n=1 Tax=Flavobacterium taihuense TaxID=2857508 RepID=A0ABS6XUA2_9FLAO|nr:DUF6252 family protein [Flavobacterium taihuense]MBW4360231.1 hypothetical protein [Flavobacterium taihuense]
MKKLFFLFATITLLISCNKDDDKPMNPIDQLPPATQIGANTAGCLVNGEALLPKGTGIILNCFYQDGLNFGLSITENKNNIQKSIGIASLNQKLEVGQTYQLTEYKSNTKYGSYIIYYSDFSEDKYLTTLLVNGELKITNHNFDKAIISGTFWFDAINSEGKAVKIREGRFDMEY